MNEEIIKRLQRRKIACVVDGCWIIAKSDSRHCVIEALKEFVSAEQIAIVTIADGIAIFFN